MKEAEITPLVRIHPAPPSRRNLLVLIVSHWFLGAERRLTWSEGERLLNSSGIFQLCGPAVGFVMVVLVIYSPAHPCFCSVSGRCWTSWSPRSHRPSRSSCKDSGLWQSMYLCSSNCSINSLNPFFKGPQGVQGFPGEPGEFGQRVRI